MFTADIATVSSRGQVAIPKDIRDMLRIGTGDKIVFLAQDGTVLVKKVESKTFEELTEPFRKSKKNVQESDVVDLIHALRKKWREADRA